MSLLRRAALLISGCYGAVLAVAGCSNAPLPQDECSWISDPNNCLQTFANDVGMRCGEPFKPNSDPIATATGLFQTRDKLDICVKTAGGQVVFDPPLKPTDLPLTTASFKILDDQANPCAEFTWSGPPPNAIGPTAFSINVDPQPAPMKSPGNPITGGTFSVAVDTSSDSGASLDVSCPGGVETHVFNTLVLEKCPAAIPLQPAAILESSPGVPPTFTTAGKEGFLRFRIVYPPDCSKITDQAACLKQPPRVVQYFDCTIPAPPQSCMDMVQDGDETDVDCGGSCASKLGIKCASGQKCLVAGDCQSGACQLNGGLKQCK